VPAPKIVIAVGACAISGGPYAGHPEVLNGAAQVVPVDLFIPGCPPHPYTILEGLLALLDRLPPARLRAIMPPDDEKAEWARRRAERALRYLGADEAGAPKTD
jgi:NADH:ubiquinone oxidoreductase subunit B-like Fe-S oxidoreductase